MNKLDKLKQTMVFAIVAVLVVVAGGWHFLISPQRSSVSSLKAQTATVVTKNSGIQSQIDQLKAQLADVTGEQKTLTAIALRLPSNLQEANLLDDLTHASDAANVDLLTITPGAPVLVSTAPAVVATVAPPSAAAGKSAAAVLPKAPVAAANQLYSLPVTLTVTGNYFDLEMYIHTLEGMRRAMLINVLSFGTVNSVGTGGGTATSTLPGGAAASGAPATDAPAAAVTSAPAVVTKSTGKNSTGSAKSAKSNVKADKGTQAGAQAELNRQVQVLSDSDTLSVTITGEVFSMYSPADAAAVAATVGSTATPTPATTK